MPHETFHQAHDLVAVEEGGLDVELRKLRLPVGAQILVAEATHDLVVAIEARHHQQLLEDLRRLRQREELPGLRAARHQVVARALGRRLGQHRRLEIDESLTVEILAHRARDRMSQPQPLLHHVAPQIEIAVLEPDLFLDVLVELEGQGLRTVEHLDLAREQLDRAGLQVRVDRTFGPRPNRARDPDHPLAAQPLGLREHGRFGRVEHDLQPALAVAKIDKDDAAMVPTAIYPAGDGNGTADEGLVNLAAVMSAHRHGDRGRMPVPWAGTCKKEAGCYGPVCGGARRPSMGRAFHVGTTTPSVSTILTASSTDMSR